jgi:hypothetical protein
MEKAIFWTLFLFFFGVILMAILLYTHQSIALLVGAVGRGLSGHFATHLLAAKHVATRLTTSARTRGAEKAIKLLSGALDNSQVA